MFQKRKTMLYFAPHQDDELLTMGIDICSSVLKHHDVHVILCTDGSKSNVRKRLNNGQKCPKHEGIHHYDLSIEAFIQARDREFMDSCRALGLDAAHIHIPEKRSIDGSLTVQAAENTIQKYLSLFGEDVTVCTISPNNGPAQHRDHKALGRAANNLLNRGIIQDLKFFIEPYHFGQIVENPRLIPIDPTIKKAPPQIEERIKKAIGAYSYWNPDEQRYAVGYHSVTTEFDDFLKNMESYSYMNRNVKTMRGIEKISYQHRKWLKFKKQKQLYYSIYNCEEPDLGQLRLIDIQPNQTEAYKDFCEKYNVVLREKDLQRLTDGSSFWCLVSGEGAVVTSMWLAYQQSFYIGETDFAFEMGSSKTAIFFDVNTKPEYRGNGYCGLLYRAVVYHSKAPERYIAYTAPDNKSSSRSILKAGFQFDGTLSASDNSMKPYLREAGFTKITRKNQLWGLRVIP